MFALNRAACPFKMAPGVHLGQETTCHRRKLGCCVHVLLRVLWDSSLWAPRAAAGAVIKSRRWNARVSHGE